MFRVFAKLTPFGALRASPLSSTAATTARIWACFFHVWRCWCVDAFYTDQLLCAHALTQRSFYTQTPLHTEAFTQRSFYTQKRASARSSAGPALLLFASSSWSRVLLPKSLFGPSRTVGLWLSKETTQNLQMFSNKDSMSKYVHLFQKYFQVLSRGHLKSIFCCSLGHTDWALTKSRIQYLRLRLWPDFVLTLGTPKNTVPQISQNSISMDWFKGKFTGHHRFSH